MMHMAKPMKSIELYYPTIRFLINSIMFGVKTYLQLTFVFKIVTNSWSSFPWMAIMLIWNRFPRSICKYGSTSRASAHHEPFPEVWFSRPRKGSNPGPRNDDDVIALSGMIPTSMPNGSKQAITKQISVSSLISITNDEQKRYKNDSSMATGNNVKVKNTKRPVERKDVLQED